MLICWSGRATERAITNASPSAINRPSSPARARGCRKSSPNSRKTSRSEGCGTGSATSSSICPSAMRLVIILCLWPIVMAHCMMLSRGWNGCAT